MITTTIDLNDRAVLASSSLKRTGDGYLAAHAKVARAGIQFYNGREVGRPDMERVRVYRPEREVFKNDTMKSLAHRPITNNHPPVMVTADNWKKYAVGHTSDEVVRDGHFVKVPMLMMDAAIIDRIESGERELSVGYTCDIKWESGISPQGEEYDAIQHNIRANHIAVVRAARGGSDLRIGDASTCPECGKPMSESAKKCLECGYVVKDSNSEEGDYLMKKFVIDGISVEMSERDAEIVQKHVTTLERSLSDAKFETAEEKKKRLLAEEEFKTDSASTTTKIVAKDKEIDGLKKALKDAEITPVKLDELVKARAIVVDKAKELLGDKIVIDGKTDHEIRKQTVDSVVGDLAADWDEKQVAASFASITVSKAVGDGTADIARSFSGKQIMGDARAAAYKEQHEHLTNAWQSK